MSGTLAVLTDPTWYLVLGAVLFTIGAVGSWCGAIRS